MKVNTFFRAGLLLLGCSLVTTHADPQTSPAPLVDGSAAIGLRFASPEPPHLRSLNVPGLFTAENTELLPMVTELRQPTEAAPYIGRIYEMDLRADLRGLWTDLGGGAWLWTMQILSPNAASLRLEFEPFRLPEGCELNIYNARNPGESYGPFSRSASLSSSFWAPTVFSNEACLELYVPPQVERSAVAGKIHIRSVAQEFPAPDDLDRGCRIDVTCDPNWANEAVGVAHIRWSCPPYICLCTGSMVNRINGDWAPLFLTAGHCINNETDANNLEVYWLYQTATCNGAAPPLGNCPRTNGATLLAYHSTADNSLLGLTGTIPGGLWWNGWDAAAIPNPTNGVLIHHPAGDRKSISYGVYEGRDDGHCAAPIDINYRLDLSDGGQEGGSSGAPGFDPSHRIRTVASCSDDPNCAPGENTWEGSFPNAYSTLSPFLDPQLDVWVNGSYGGTERGTQTQPWNTIIEGYFGVRSGGTIHIQTGTYPPATLRGSRSMRLQAEGGTVRIGS